MCGLSRNNEIVHKRMPLDNQIKKSKLEMKSMHLGRKPCSAIRERRATGPAQACYAG
jgi:hypothetical protein